MNRKGLEGFGTNVSGRTCVDVLSWLVWTCWAEGPDCMLYDSVMMRSFERKERVIICNRPIKRYIVF